MRSLLLVYHSRTGLAASMANAIESGALWARNEMEVPANEFEVKKI